MAGKQAAMTENIKYVALLITTLAYFTQGMIPVRKQKLQTEHDSEEKIRNSLCQPYLRRIIKEFVRFEEGKEYIRSEFTR
jgi:hypothetical protein